MTKNMYSKVLLEDLEYIAHISLNWDKFRNTRVLITGATGLIGSLLVRSLLYCNRKHQLHLTVIAFVRNVEKAKNLFRDIQEREALEIIQGDVKSFTSEQCNGKLDYIFHTACITDSKMMITSPVELIQTAVFGTDAILTLAREKGVRSVVYISSMEVYGVVDGKYVSEKDLGFIDPLLIRSNYPESKRLCENMCVAYVSEYNVPVRIARLAQTFGAGVSSADNRAFAQFARSALNNQNIVLHTCGLSEGNYCYTSDAVSALLFILLNGVDGEAYNIANEEMHTTILGMAEMVAKKIAPQKIDVAFDIPHTNSYGYAADTKLKLNSDKLRALGWKPHIDLENAYRRLITYWEENV